MENKDKINIINSRINNLSYHISILTSDIEKVPDGDLDGKPSRDSVLQDFISKRTALINELNAID